MQLNVMEILASFMVLFAIIDILGSIPIILDIKAKTGSIFPGKTTLVAYGIMLLFLFIGEPLLGIFGVDISSFAIAGSGDQGEGDWNDGTPSSRLVFEELYPKDHFKSHQEQND